MASKIDIDFGLNATDFINGINAVESNVKLSTAAVNRQIQTLAKEYQTLSGNIDNYERYKAALRGADASQRSRVQNLLSGIEALKKEKIAQAEAAHAAEQIMLVERKREASLNSMIASIDKEHFAIGKTNAEIKLHEMKLLGATDAQIRYAHSQLLAINGTKQQASSISLVSQRLTQLAIGYAGIQGFTMLSHSMDEWTTLNNRIKLVTQNSSEFKIAQQGIVSISKSTGQALGSIGSTYQSIARAQGELGLSQQQVLDLTETISKAMVIGGGSAEGNAAALLQLGQALSSGVLRGEEFNSIMEQAPGIAKALAEGLNVPVGALRKMAENGELTSEVVTKALQKSSASISRDFKTMDLTISQSFQVMKTSFTAFIGQSSDASGASKMLSKSIRFAAENLDILAMAAIGLVGVKIGLWMKKAIIDGVLWAANLVLQRNAAIANAAANRASASAIASHVPASISATASVTTFSGALTVLKTSAIGSAAALKGVGAGAAAASAPIAALVFGLEGLKAIVNASQGKDASNWISDLVDSLFGLDSRVESIGTKIADYLHDDKGNFRIEKVFMFGFEMHPVNRFAKMLFGDSKLPDLSIPFKAAGQIGGGIVQQQMPTTAALNISQSIEKTVAEFEKMQQTVGMTTEDIKLMDISNQIQKMRLEKNSESLVLSAEKNYASAKAAYEATKAKEAEIKKDEELARLDEQNAKFVADEISKRATLVSQLGQTSEEITSLAMAARGATESQIKQVKAMDSVIGEYEKQKNVMQQLESLDKQIARLGKTDSEAKLMDLKDAGATEEQLALARQQLGYMDDFKRSTELQRNAAMRFDKSVELNDTVASKFADGVDGFVGGVDKLNAKDKPVKSALSLDGAMMGFFKGNGWYNDHVDKDPTGRLGLQGYAQQAMSQTLKKLQDGLSEKGKQLGTLLIATQDGSKSAELQVTQESYAAFEKMMSLFLSKNAAQRS